VRHSGRFICVVFYWETCFVWLHRWLQFIFGLPDAYTNTVEMAARIPKAHRGGLFTMYRVTVDHTGAIVGKVKDGTFCFRMFSAFVSKKKDCRKKDVVRLLC
jgi:hypothetical protein